MLIPNDPTRQPTATSRPILDGLHPKMIELTSPIPSEISG